MHKIRFKEDIGKTGKVAMVSADDGISWTEIEEIGKGGQAKIYKVPSGSLSQTATLALKKYKPKDFSGNEDSMEAYLKKLIGIRDRASEDVKKILDQYTTWPRKIIYEYDKVCGYVMRFIPNIFYNNMNFYMDEPESIASTLGFIYNGDVINEYRKKHNLPIITDKGMAMLVYSLLKVIFVLHRENIIIGDFSQNNVLMYVDNQQQSKNRVLFIDTDSFNLAHDTHPLDQKHSKGWTPPECERALKELSKLPTGADQKIKVSLEMDYQIQTKATDVYKICLAIMRLYHEGENRSTIYFSATAKERLTRKLGSDFSNNVFMGLSDDPKQRPTIDTLYKNLIDSLNSKRSKI